VRETLTKILGEDRRIRVTAAAANPLIAMKKLETDRPDVIVLDIEMPKMDGLTFLQKLMSENPLPVIICSSKSESGSQNALQAMEYGAVEIIQKPKIGTKQFFEESKVIIIDAVIAASQAKLGTRGRPSAGSAGSRGSASGAAGTAAPGAGSDGRGGQAYEKHTADVIMPRTGSQRSIETTEKVIVVGASTGGTEALRVFLEMMPMNSPPIVIVQHMPEKFTTAFATRLNNLCEIEVKEAVNNDTLLRGRALIAPGNRHTLLKRSGARYYVEVKEGPLVSRHRPSVDVLFRSASRYGGRNVIGIIMTGMGDDGASGMAEMKEAGAHTIAQDEKTSVVFGMPNEAIKRGAVNDVLSLDAIAGRALEIAKK
jgi:two-component system chemotaxis response regulator CheB